jgi:hypothetical protein
MTWGNRVLAQAKARMTAWRDFSLPLPAVAFFVALVDLGPETLHDSRVIMDQSQCVDVFHSYGSSAQHVKATSSQSIAMSSTTPSYWWASKEPRRNAQ